MSTGLPKKVLETLKPGSTQRPEIPKGMFAQQSADGWLPIETAPRDGTRIIVYRPKFDGDYIPQVGWDFWMTHGLLDPTWGKSRRDCPPSHWQPFPAPPSKQSQDQR